MATDHHTAAQELADRAAELRRDGMIAQARELCVRAAKLEESALLDVPSALSRTRGVLSVSAVALYYKGTAYELAEAAAHRFLIEPSLPQFARAELRELLEEVWNAQILKTSSATEESATVEIALRGSAIGVGEAAIETASEQLGAVERLVYRAIEWLGNFEFRVQGPPTQRVREACRVIVSQPQAGSYRFRLRLAPPTQPFLPDPFDAGAIRPDRVAAFVVKLVEGAIAGPPREIAADVTDSRYKEALLKLVRNLEPDGDRVREVQFRLVGSEPERPILLREGIRERIRAALPSEAVATPDAERRAGILRALHLDKKWLEIVQDNEEHLTCHIEHLLLDDVVGPMVNRMVTVTGKWRGNRRRRFVVGDVELGGLAASAPQV